MKMSELDQTNKQQQKKCSPQTPSWEYLGPCTRLLAYRRGDSSRRGCFTREAIRSCRGQPEGYLVQFWYFPCWFWSMKMSLFWIFLEPSVQVYSDWHATELLLISICMHIQRRPSVKSHKQLGLQVFLFLFFFISGQAEATHSADTWVFVNIQTNSQICFRIFGGNTYCIPINSFKYLFIHSHILSNNHSVFRHLFIQGLNSLFHSLLQMFVQWLVNV